VRKKKRWRNILIVICGVILLISFELTVDRFINDFNMKRFWFMHKWAAENPKVKKTMDTFNRVLNGGEELMAENMQEQNIAKNYRNYIYYHCADWGPDGKIYFLKQTIFYEGDRWFDNRVDWCNMDPDGNNKKVIKTLWENTKYQLDINGNNVTMDICKKTGKVALAIAAGGSEQTGIWTFDLDGTELKRIVENKKDKNFRYRVNYPSWFPDGEHLVYHEKWLHTKEIEYYIVKIDNQGQNKLYLTTKKTDGNSSRFPAVSPDGIEIVYTNSNKLGEYQRDLWVMTATGEDKLKLYNNHSHYADYAEWSSDSKKIVLSTPPLTIINSEDGEEIKRTRIAGSRVRWSEKGNFVMEGRGFVSTITSSLEQPKDVLIAQYINTEAKKDLSTDEYIWGHYNET